MKTFFPWLILGALFLAAVSAVGATRYVNLNNLSPSPPYASWGAAATNIQDAIDVAIEGDLVLVTNGIYQTGGRIAGSLLQTNRVALTIAVTMQSVNGPTVTTIKGYQMPEVINGTNAIRCLFLTNGSMVVGFTLTGGATLQGYGNYGGGAYCELGSTAVLSNCIISANSASYEGGGAYGCMIYDSNIANNKSGLSGGGVSQCIVYNCTVIGNQASNEGGGAWQSTLNNCTISGNSAADAGGGGGYSKFNNCVVVGNSASNGGGGGRYTTMRNCLVTGNVAYGVYGGGGAYMATVINCTVVANRSQNLNGGRGGGTYSGSAVNSIVYFNTSYSGSSTRNYVGGSFNNCCTTPLPAPEKGVRNFVFDPALVNLGGGDFRLQTNSPCINSGNNASITSGLDLDSNARIIGGTCDIGAYEFRWPSSLLSYVWAQQFGFSTDGASDFNDPDGDGMNNYGEWRSDTDPTEALSALRMLKPTYSPAGVILTWQSVSTRSYWLERATNFGQTTQFDIIATDIIGAANTTMFVDSSTTNASAYYYRVGVP